MKQKPTKQSGERRIPAAVLFFLLLSGAAFPLPSRAESPNLVSLGLLSDLTGTNGPNGDACREGYELARRLYAPGDREKEHPIEFVFGDHKGEPKTGVSEFLRVTGEGHAIAVLANRGNVGMAMDPISVRSHIPLIGVMGHADFILRNPYGFRFWPSPKQEGRALAKAALKIGKRVGSISFQDEYIVSIVKSFKTELERDGGEMVFNDATTEQDTDWAALLLRLRSAKPDVLFLNTTVNKLGALVRRTRELGLTQPIVSNFWLSYPDVAKAAGSEAIEGAGFVTLGNDSPKFVAELQKQFPEATPNAVSYACFSALAFVLENIPAGTSEVTAESLRKSLLAAPAVSLPDGEMPMRGREAQFPLFFQTYRNGKPGPAVPAN